MSLVWHIVKKDVRRVVVPWAIWLASFTAMGWGFRLAAPSDFGPWDDVAHWLNGFAGISTVMVTIQMVMGGLLAGYILLDDAVVDPAAFWKTRPIAGWHLLAAKVVTLGLCLVLAPMLALVPVWLGSDFSVGDVLEAIGWSAKWHVLVVTATLATATLTKNIVHLLLLSVGALQIAGVAIMREPALHSTVDQTWHLELGSWPMLTVGCAGLVLTLASAYVWRSTRSSWIALGITATLLLVGRFWLFTADFRPDLRAANEAVAEQDAVRGEIPIRIGAEFRAGPAQRQIVAVQRKGDTLTILLDEYDAWPRVWDTARSDERYFIKLPSHGVTTPLAVIGKKTVARYSMVRALIFLACELPAQTPEGAALAEAEWERKGKLIKVRVGTRQDGARNPAGDALEPKNNFIR